MKFIKILVNICYNIWAYVTCGLLFAGFVLWNGSIVVGDHSAHKPTLHLPQILYFSAFTFAFTWPYMIHHWKTFLQNSLKHWVLSLIFIATCAAIIGWNTLVHPFVLADNRHYVFYIWNRFLRREAFRYILIPVYAFSLYGFWKCLNCMKVSTRISYSICVILVLVPQLLLEPRYFLTPYVFFRLHVKAPENWQVLMEFVTMITVNLAQFYIFVGKTFDWENMNYPQRIGW